MTTNDTTIPQPGSIQDIWEICWSNLTTKYARFSGTATRREFWTFFFALLVVELTAFIFVFIPVFGILMGIFYILFAFYTLVPALAVGARLLHDMGHSGWWQLLQLIPIFGVIALIIMWAQPTSDPYVQVRKPSAQHHPVQSTGPIQH